MSEELILLEDRLPEVGSLVWLHFFDGHIEPAHRIIGSRLKDQWYWEGACTFFPSDMPQILGWYEHCPDIW